MGKIEYATKSPCKGVSSAGETCLSVSLSEGKEPFLGDLKRRDLKSAKWAKDKRFRFLELLPVKMEGVGVPRLASR
jgi:hypothetical protein